MIIAIDDSGDPGFKLGRGSTDYFAIATIFFDDDLDAEEMALKIKRLRKSLRWSELHEFKFRKTSGEIKELFFKTVRGLEFRAVVALIDKSKVTDATLKKNPSKFYNAVIPETFKMSSLPLKKAHIYIDGEAGYNYRRRAKVFFRQNLPKNAVKEVTYTNSRSDNLIQLADMIAGAVKRSADTHRDDHKTYVSLIKKRIEQTVTTL